ncbi:MAG: tail fiber protein [Terracidiphilus sp.]
MSTAYVGEVRLIGFTFAPVGWRFCDGSFLDISTYNTLYALIGTTYGGNGQTNFAVPDLRGRVPVHQGTLQGGSSYVIGQASGLESVTLGINQIPSHNHLFQCNSSSQGGNNIPANNAVGGGPQVYRATFPDAMNQGMLSSAGGSQPHENRQPYQAMNWVIAFNGIYPSQG